MHLMVSNPSDFVEEEFIQAVMAAALASVAGVSVISVEMLLANSGGRRLQQAAEGNVLAFCQIGAGRRHSLSIANVKGALETFQVQQELGRVISSAAGYYVNVVSMEVKSAEPSLLTPASSVVGSAGGVPHASPARVVAFMVAVALVLSFGCFMSLLLRRLLVQRRIQKSCGTFDPGVPSVSCESFAAETSLSAHKHTDSGLGHLVDILEQQGSAEDAKGFLDIPEDKRCPGRKLEFFEDSSVLHKGIETLFDASPHGLFTENLSTRASWNLPYINSLRIGPQPQGLQYEPWDTYSLAGQVRAISDMSPSLAKLLQVEAVYDTHRNDWLERAVDVAPAAPAAASRVPPMPVQPLCCQEDEVALDVRGTCLDRGKDTSVVSPSRASLAPSGVQQRLAAASRPPSGDGGQLLAQPARPQSPNSPHDGAGSAWDAPVEMEPRRPHTQSAAWSSKP